MFFIWLEGGEILTATIKPEQIEIIKAVQQAKALIELRTNWNSYSTGVKEMFAKECVGTRSIYEFISLMDSCIEN